jgi:hypothetical protein
MRTVQENNGLIADFMEQLFHNGNTFIPEYNRYIGSQNFSSFFKVSDLRYHELWDWLMPVVDKIEDIQDGEDGDAIRFHYYDFEIRHITCKIHGTNIEILDADSKIDAVYQAVIQFIEHYNNQK